MPSKQKAAQTPTAMSKDEINSRITDTKAAVAEIWGDLPVNVNVRPNKRVIRAKGDHVGEEVVYNTQIEVEVYVPGPGQVQEAVEAAERDAAAEAEAAAASGRDPDE